MASFKVVADRPNMVPISQQIRDLGVQEHKNRSYANWLGSSFGLVAPNRQHVRPTYFKAVGCSVLDARDAARFKTIVQPCPESPAHLAGLKQWQEKVMSSGRVGFANLGPRDADRLARAFNEASHEKMRLSVANKYHEQKGRSRIILYRNHQFNVTKFASSTRFLNQARFDLGEHSCQRGLTVWFHDKDRQELYATPGFFSC